MKLELKAYKPHRGLSQETMAFTATLYVDGKHSGKVSNQGRGGCHFYEGDVAIAIAYAKSLPAVITELGALPMDLDCLIDDLIASIEDKKWIKRQIKTKVVFRLKGADKGSWLTIKHQGQQEATIAHIRKEYGDKIDEIHG